MVQIGFILTVLKCTPQCWTDVVLTVPQTHHPVDHGE